MVNLSLAEPFRPDTTIDGGILRVFIAPCSSLGFEEFV